MCHQEFVNEEALHWLLARSIVVLAMDKRVKQNLKKRQAASQALYPVHAHQLEQR